MTNYKIQKFPKSRIATIDVCSIGLKKHHVAAMIEVDVTESRAKIKEYSKNRNKISFTAWLIKAISVSVKSSENVAAYLKGKSRIIFFNDINVSIVVEKEIDGQKVPIPLIIEKANSKSIESITAQLRDARNEVLTNQDIVLQKKSNQIERFYYILPGFLRRFIWKILLKNPRLAFNKMGNVAITSVGVGGNINGWFIPISVHPICFGISSITKKSVVINDKVEIREMINMTVLVDHDVIDGVSIARFISTLSKNIKNGVGL